MHNVNFILKRFGKKGYSIVVALVLLSAIAAGVGLGLLFLM